MSINKELLLNIEQLKKIVEAEFPSVYGKYESVSGQVWLEICTNENSDSAEAFPVSWKAGRYGTTELDIEETLTIPIAMRRFSQLMQGGYTKIFRAKTEAEMRIGNSDYQQTKSKFYRDGKLGTYYRNDSYISFSEYTAGEFYIEYGYDGASTDAETLNEELAEAKLAEYLELGYAKRSAVEPFRFTF